MYERFTDRARKVMSLANQEAQRFNHEYIGTEHVLLGVVKEGSGVAANVLKNLDVDLSKVRLAVEKLIQSGPEMVTMGKLPQTPLTKKVMERAMESARDLNHNYVGTEHVLLGLLRVDGTAQQVLESLDVSPEGARAATLALLGHDPEDRSTSQFEPPKHPWHHPETRVRRAELPSLVLQSKVGFPPFCEPQQLNPLITAINRKWRNSVLIVGERGVGKRALVERLANEIVVGHASVIHACGKQITEIRLNESAQRIERAFDRASTRRLMFVENIHMGLADGQAARVPSERRRKEVKSFRRLLTNALDAGGRCIATTTEVHLQSFFACEELAAHFSLLRLSPASSEHSMEIAKSRLDDYKANCSVRFHDGAYQEACELAERYGDELFPGYAQPALILDVLEHAAAYTDWKQAKDSKSKIQGDVPAKELHAHDIQHIVALRLGKDIDDVKARK